MKRVLLLQLPPPRFCFEEAPANIPLAAGFLVAALESRGSGGFAVEIAAPDFVDVFAEEGLAARILEMSPAAVGMTLYVWNVQRSLFLAATIKERSPGTQVFVGGPEVTPDNVWVMEHPAVDGGVFGEGESRIGPLLPALLSGGAVTGPPGTFVKKQGRLTLNRGSADPWDLSSCPYPYLDERIGPSRDGTLFLETVRGCPFRCRYCYYHKTFREVRFNPERSIETVLDMAYAHNSRVREIYLMDPTFNARKGFRGLLRSLARRRRAKDVAVHTELRADLLTRADVLMLKEAGLKSAEVGLQTVNAAALKQAGRSGDPGDMARGVAFLREAGVEVTTGIILGLPGDTPEGFLRTLAWLKREQAYSIVHPFVLSVLPGTDFREQASALGLAYDPRPPYYVRSTQTFSAEEMQRALLECERAFDMEIDYIGRPSLVDRGPGTFTRPGRTPYVSKWIVDPTREEEWRGMWSQFIEKATNPFTLWFRNGQSERTILEIIRAFGTRNPHTVLNVVFEFPGPPAPELLERVLESVADPGLFLNRSYVPLYGEGAIVSPDLTLILPDPGNHVARERLTEEYASTAVIVWDLADVPFRGSSPNAASPALFSHSVPEGGDGTEHLLNELERAWRNRPDEILFRDPGLQTAWNERHRPVNPAHRFPEGILLTL